MINILNIDCDIVIERNPADKEIINQMHYLFVLFPFYSWIPSPNMLDLNWLVKKRGWKLPSQVSDTAAIKPMSGDRGDKAWSEN